jgi:hypothetical protein
MWVFFARLLAYGSPFVAQYASMHLHDFPVIYCILVIIGLSSAWIVLMICHPSTTERLCLVSFMFFWPLLLVLSAALIAD